MLDKVTPCVYNYQRPLDETTADLMDGRLAQLGEHLPYKQGVTGSSPVLSTRIWPGGAVG